MKKALVIINPKAGRGKLARELAEIDNILYQGGYEADIYFTKCRKDATAKVEKDAGMYDIVVCGGGDGTYNEVITGLLNSELNIPVGYIPSGTTNDFATTLEIPTVYRTAAEKIVSGEPRKIDVGKFGDVYFSYIASFGAFTRASYEANQKIKNVLGHMAYILEGIKDISSIKSYKLKIETEDELIDDEFIFCAVCNSKSIAGLIRLDEKIVDLSDGMFELILVRMPDQIIEFPSIISSLKKGSNNDKNLVFIHTNSVKIKTESNLDWSLDGEHVESTGDIEIKNLNGAVSLIL